MLYSQCWSKDPNNRPLCEEIHCCLNLLLSEHLFTSELNFQSQNLGATVIVKALESNFSLVLVRLDISKNQIGDIGVTALAKALQSKILNNQISHIGTTALAKRLNCIFQLIRLEIWEQQHWQKL